MNTEMQLATLDDATLDSVAGGRGRGRKVKIDVDVDIKNAVTTTTTNLDHVVIVAKQGDVNIGNVSVDQSDNA